MSAPFTQSGCPLELSLTTITPTYRYKEIWIAALLSALEVLKVGKNHKISRFLRFSRFLTNFEFLPWRLILEVGVST